jgi:APA family basic amino acid/polyamine antiporter
MRALVGEGGARFITAGIVVSTFGFLNLVIMVSPRVYQTMAADGLFFQSLARLHPVHRTPAAAIVFQCVWAILLTGIGKYGQLLDYVVFGDWIFFGLAVAALFVYRAREQRSTGSKASSTGFRTPLYPLTPVLFILAAIYVVAGSVTSNPANAVKGSLLLGVGIPVFLFWRWRMRAPGARC